LTQPDLEGLKAAAEWLDSRTLKAVKDAASCCRVAAQAFETALEGGSDFECLFLQGLENLKAGQTRAAAVLQKHRRAARRRK
jgi:hypothetical protein